MKKIVLAAALCSSFLFAGNSTEEFFYQSGYDQGQKDGFDKGVREAFKSRISFNSPASNSFWYFPRQVLAVRTSGPLTPKCVKRNSPNPS